MTTVWFVSSLEQKGGGERFALEAVAALRDRGVDARIVCDRLDEAASFDGRYDLDGVICTGEPYNGATSYLRRVMSKARGLVGLFGILKRMRPEIVVCQSEYDAIKIYLLSRVLGFRYRVYVFGQMFQFRTDISRYSRTFRRHLETIVASRPGYVSTVAMPPPRFSPGVTLVNEIVSRLKYFAIRSADRIFTLSDQVKWEVSLLYGRDDAVTLPAAFDESFINEAAILQPRPVGRPVRLLSVCRLAEKKRVELTISGFSESSLPGELILVGTGPEEARLHSLAGASRRSQDIHFLGSVDDDQLRDELARADCFISMDIGDYDISVVEAMARGLRVIVPQDFDLSAFAPGFTGVIQVAPTTDAVERAISSIEQMSAPGPANLAALKKQTWQHIAQIVAAS
ncbi:glycosyltransferase family 4 protein [Brevundimonas sp. BR2-1]|uniref:glycosyltransferase family 4 protein n=1 Tax=Brevundimonas sp. BR2-1 TaxID=3031123 RepID=UPI0030A0382F